MSDAAELRVVLCTAPAEHAETIARALLDQRLAACVNVLPGVVSFYWWQGAVTKDAEVLLVMKTRAELLPSLTEAIRSVHPYDVPEVIALPLAPGEGNADYIAWLLAETARPVAAKPES